MRERGRWALVLACGFACAASPVVAQVAVVADRATPVAPIASFDSAWASISRTYWDAALLDGAWRVARDSLRGALGGAPTDDAVRDAIRALIAVPKQSHFVLIPASAAPGGAKAVREPGAAGLEVRMIDGAYYVGAVATLDCRLHQNNGQSAQVTHG